MITAGLRTSTVSAVRCTSTVTSTILPVHNPRVTSNSLRGSHDTLAWSEATPWSAIMARPCRSRSRSRSGSGSGSEAFEKYLTAVLAPLVGPSFPVAPTPLPSPSQNEQTRDRRALP